MLLLLLLLHYVIANDFQNEATHPIVVPSVESCPGQRYFFTKDSTSSELQTGLCYLCFCKNLTALCWLRPSSECSTKIHLNNDKSRGRYRRNPPSNIIKYAVKNIFSKQSSQACTPLGSTFSDGCPPDDWCLGCTVCGCEVSGRWNCHLLSFCSDKKLMKYGQAYNNTSKQRSVRIHPILNNLMNTTKMHKLPRRLGINHNNVKQWRQEFSASSRNPYLPKHDDNVVVFEKELVGGKSKEIQGVRVKKILNENNTNVKLAHKVVQRAMAAVHKIINKTERNSVNSTKLLKVIQKRSMSQHDIKTNYQTSIANPLIYKKSSPRRFKKKLSLNKITDEMVGNKRMRRNILDQGITTAAMQTTKDIFNYSLQKSTVTKLPKTNPTRLNEYEYYRYNIETDRKSNVDNNDMKIKHLRYNYTHENFLKKVLQNLTVPNLCSSLKSLNLSIWQGKSKKQRFKSIKLTNKKYVTASGNINDHLDYNEHDQLQKENFGQENKKQGSSESENLNTISSMLNRKGIYQRVFRKTKRLSKNKYTVYNFDFIHILNSLLNKIFSTSKDGKHLGNDKHNLFDKQNLLETFCAKNTSCKIHPRDEVKLQIKINELNGEMYKVMETIKIIKTLLPEIINSKVEVENVNNIKSKNNKNKITRKLKLNLYYIKESIKTFIKSIGKLSLILQDILYIVSDKENITYYRQRSSHRPLRCARTNDTGKTNSQLAEQRLKKLKTMLIHYNLLQNTFMRKIYEMLNKFESNLTNTETKTKFKKLDRLNIKDNTKSFSIETFTQSIIENLQKLKNLAKKFSSATINRKKRSPMEDDDAIEYLLTIMEYLLRQNYPLDTAPVNDGIDLLIDAIKHAPDIKSMKKKVLNLPSTKASVTRTTPKLPSETYSYVDNIYGIDSVEKDNNDTNRSDDNQISISNSMNDGNEKLEDFQKLLHGPEKNSNSFILSNFNSILKNAQIKPKATTQPPFVTTTPLIQYDFLKDNLAETDTENPGNIGRGDKNEVVVKFKSGHKQDENEGYSSSLAKIISDPDAEIHVTGPTRTLPTQRTTRKFHHMIREKFENPQIITYNRKLPKSKFDWVEYDQGEDGKKIERKTLSKPKEKYVTAPKKEIMRPFDKNDVSTISEESVDDKRMNQFNKLLPTAELKKLNSVHFLEYGTMKSDTDSEFKDVEGEDSYVNDVFPSYFA